MNYEKTKTQGFVCGYKVSAGVNNLFNHMPPLAPLSYPAAKSNANADTSTYSPIGRLILITGSERFQARRPPENVSGGRQPYL